MKTGAAAPEAALAVMSERVRRSTRLQDKREKLAAKVRRKKSRTCRIVDDDSSSSDSVIDDSLASTTTYSTVRKCQIGSRGGNFTKV